MNSSGILGEIGSEQLLVAPLDSDSLTFVIVGDTSRLGTGTSDYPSNHASDSTVKTVATVKKASVSWADVARGTSHRASNERAVCNQLAPNRMFRDTILTKQSSI